MEMKFAIEMYFTWIEGVFELLGNIVHIPIEQNLHFDFRVSVPRSFPCEIALET